MFKLFFFFTRMRVITHLYWILKAAKECLNNLSYCSSHFTNFPLVRFIRFSIVDCLIEPSIDLNHLHITVF